MFSFLRKRRMQTALFRAICDRNLPLIKELVDDGLDLNFVMQGISPLSRAVWKLDHWTLEDRKMVDLLIANGASPSMAGNGSILVGAARVGDHGLIDRALAAGHDIHFRPRNTPSPLQVAAFQNKPETMKYLIGKGATKEDFDTQMCRWTSIRPATINVLVDLGVVVPRECLLNWE